MFGHTLLSCPGQTDPIPSASSSSSSLSRPHKPNPWAIWFNARDREIALARSKRYGRAQAKNFTFAAVKRTVKQPLIYAFAFLYVGTVLAAYGQNYFNLFLKSLRNADGSKTWSVEALNLVPIGGNVMTVVFVWIWAFASDYFQTRWLIVVAQCTIGLIPSIIMSIWNVPLSAKYFSCTSSPFFPLSPRPSHSLPPLSPSLPHRLRLVRHPRYRALLLRLALRHVPARRRAASLRESPPTSLPTLPFTD